MTLCWIQVFLFDLEDNFPEKLELPSMLHTAISVCLLTAKLHVMAWCNYVYWSSPVIWQSIQSWGQTQQSVSFFNVSPLTLYVLNIYAEFSKFTSWLLNPATVQLVAGPLGNSLICFPKNFDVSQDEKHWDLRESKTVPRDQLLSI